ncbi:DNA repair protein RadC [Chloroflexota bacterium]
MRKFLTPLQDRFVGSGFEGLNEQEIVELLLSLVLTARESKKMARISVERFKSLNGLLAASHKQLERIGFTPHCICGLRLIRELPAHVLKQKVIEKAVHGSPADIFNYLYYSMRDLTIEIFKVLYLNAKKQIIDIADLFKGEVEAVHIYPRKIVRYAFRDNAAALIFVHNHPSGDLTPSKNDKRLTRDLVFTGEILQINVLDHLIIGDNSYFSFADEGLIEEYALDFLNLKLRGTSEAGRRLHLARVFNGKLPSVEETKDLP